MYYLRSAMVYLWAAVVMSVAIPYRYWYRRIAEKEFDRGMQGMHRLAHWFAGTIVSLAGVRIEVQGEENLPDEGPAVYIGNHQSFFDIPILLSLIKTPTGFLAKKELKKVPLLATWITAIGSGFIEREDDRSTLKVVLDLARQLKETKHSLVVFPEGTRTLDGTVGPYKSGSLKMATRSGTPLIPFAIDGSDRVMPKGHKGFKRETVIVTFFPAVAIHDSKQDTGSLAENCRVLTISALEKSTQTAKETAGIEKTGE